MAPTFRWRAAPALVALACWVSITAPAAGQGEADSLSASFRKAARRVLPAVVTVRPLGVVNPFALGPGVPPFAGGSPFLGGSPPVPRGFLPDGPPREAGGSGVVIDAEKGYVLTNDHVVQGASRVVVILHDGRERAVAQVRRDPKSDLALLIVDGKGKGLTQADWGDSEALDTGDWVLAIGQPFGLSDTVTAGIVSGKGRGIGMAMYEDLIQTDAAINPGNSGGPLVNLKGEVVGINTAIKTTGGGYEGVGFAIPATRARRVAADLTEHGRVRRAYLGINIGPVDRETAGRIDQPGSVAVNGVSPGSPAAQAGLRRDDVIVGLEGKPVGGPGALQAAIEVAPLGKPLALTIDRDGERLEIKIVPEPQPDAFGLPEPDRERPGASGPRPSRARPEGGPRPPTPAPLDEARATTIDVPFPELGLRLSEHAPDLVGRYRAGRPAHGLVVVGIVPDGPADRGGLEFGMVITDVADRKVESLDDFRKALAGRPEGRDLVVRILKGTKAEFRLIPAPSETPSRTEPERRPKTDSP